MPAAACRSFPYCTTRSPIAASYTASGWRCSRRPIQRVRRPRSRFWTLATTCMALSPSGGALARVFAADAELAHLLLEVLAVHADVLGGLGDVAAVAAERAEQVVALECLDHALFRLAEGCGRGGGRRRARVGRGVREEIGCGDLRPRRQEQRLLHCGTELAHVALPRVRQAGAQRLAGEGLHLAPEALG